MRLMKRYFSTVGILVCFCLSVAVLLFIMNLFGPGDFGVGGIFLVLLSVYVTCFLLFALIFRLFEMIRGFIDRDSIKDVAKLNHRRKQMLLASAVLAFAPLLLISINSLGQMQIWYIALVILFELVAIIFIIKKI